MDEFPSALRPNQSDEWSAIPHYTNRESSTPLCEDYLNRALCIQGQVKGRAGIIASTKDHMHSTCNRFKLQLYALTVVTPKRALTESECV